MPSGIRILKKFFLQTRRNSNNNFKTNRLGLAKETGMSLDGTRIIGVKALNINEESSEAIEKMVENAIQEIRSEGLEILDIQTSSDYLIMILGKI